MDTTTSLRGDARDDGRLPAASTTSQAARATRTPASGRDRGARDHADVARQAAMLTMALALTIPLASLTILWVSHHTTDLNRAVFYAPCDFVVAAALLWTIGRRRVLADLFRSRAVAIVSGAYVALFAVSFAIHPSWFGVAEGFHLAGGLAVIAVVYLACSTPATRRAVVATVTVAGVFEAVLAILQAHHHGPLGIAYIDFNGPLYQFGSSFAGRGGFTHPYHLDVMLVVAEAAAVLGYRSASAAGARHRWAWVGAAFVLSAGLGVTYSRTAVIGQAVLVVAAFASRDRRILIPFAVAVVAGLVIGGASFGNGWVARASTSTSSSQFDSDRRARLEESLVLLRSSPVVGVGPGRYAEALSHTNRDSHLPSHDLIAQEGAELGVLGYALSAAFLGLLAVRAWRGGAWSIAVIAPVVPFLLLDSYAYEGTTGLALSAVWLGLARVSLAGPEGVSEPRSAPAGAA